MWRANYGTYIFWIFNSTIYRAKLFSTYSTLFRLWINSIGWHAAPTTVGSADHQYTWRFTIYKNVSHFDFLNFDLIFSAPSPCSPISYFLTFSINSFQLLQHHFLAFSLKQFILFYKSCIFSRLKDTSPSIIKSHSITTCSYGSWRE